MRIAQIESRAYRLPLQQPMVSAKYLITHNELVVTTVTADDGTTGTGWCTTVGVGAGAVLSLLDGYLAPLIDGEDPRDTERLWETLWQDAHFLGPGGVTTLAIACIDIALWDLKSKAAGLPLWQMLGGARETVPVYASAVNLHLSKDEVLAQTEAQVTAGYDVFKLKIGRADFEEDLDRMRAVRQLIGPRRTLLLDVNQRWTSGEAVRLCHLLTEACNPAWIEEPLLSDDVAGHAHLRRAGGIPVAVGEQLCNRFDFWNYVREGAVDFVQPNPWKVGGITEWIKIAHLAQHANLPVAPHNSLELSCHLVGAVSNGWMVENISGGNLIDRSAVSAAPEVRDARISIGRTPGHGVVFDLPAIAEHEVRADLSLERQATVHGGL